MIIIKGEGKKIEYMVKEYRQKVSRIKQLDELKDRLEYKKKATKRREQRKKAIYKSKLNDNKQFSTIH